MKGRLWVSVPLVGVALAGAVYFVRHTDGLRAVGKKASMHLPQVQIVGITPSRSPAALAPVVQRQTQNLSAAVGAAPDAPAAQLTAGVATVRSGDLVRKLKQTLTLSDQEEGRVQGVFKTASAIQAGIDAEPSADNRQLYQKQLVEQVELRLKLILKDDRRFDFARAELQGLPRLELGG